MSLEDNFQTHILDQHRIAKEATGYKAPLFKRMVNERGALQAAKDLLNGPNRISEGLTNLVLYGRLDLSLEANVIKHEWRSLFNVEQLETAVRRLNELDCPVDNEVIQYIEKLKSGNKIKSERKSYTTNSIIRDQGLPKIIKELYEYKCQICNTRLEAQNYWYAEAAHIKPLGSPHEGEDALENILCLCPNHHKLFDIGGISIDNDFTVKPLNTKLNIANGHNIDLSSIQYHRNWCAKANK